MISIALCTRNRPQHLTTWLAHMAEVHDSAKHPILIIDQSDVALNHSWPPHITYVHTPTRGLSHARNLAVQRCTTPYILFTDDDCRPAHDWIIHAHECISRDPTVAVWFGQAWPSGTAYTIHHYHTHAGQITWASRHDGATCHALRIDDQPFRTSHPVAVLERLGHGNQLLIHCDTLRQIGGFTSWLGAGAWLHSGEDVDMTMRMLAHGHVCAFAPTLRITHDAWVIPVEHARLVQRYNTGMLALHLFHAWQGNQVAYDYLRFRTKEATNAQKKPTTGPSVPRWRHLVAILHGFIGGIGLILRQMAS
jgi:GT2 family glycosyltransferase